MGLSTGCYVMEQIRRRGWDKAQMNMEAISAMQGQMSRAWSQGVDVLMLPFTTSEMLNRAATIAGAYKGLLEQESGAITDKRREELLLKARDISDKAHGIYGKINKPSYARGNDIGAQVLSSAYMFKTFSHNYLQFGAVMAKERQFSALAFHVTAPAILAGASVSVASPAIQALIRLLWSGFEEPPDNLWDWLADWASQVFGDPAGNFVKFGLAGAGGYGINIKGSLQIGINDLPTDLNSLLGAPWSFVKDITGGISDIAGGDFLKGLEKTTPRAIRGGIRAVRESTAGVTTNSGQPVYFGEEQLRANYYQSMIRALGFNPVGLADAREQQWNESKITGQYAQMRQEIYARIRNFALYVGEPADWMDILSDINAYNGRVTRQGYNYVPFIDEPQIKGVITRATTAPKRELERFNEVERDTPDVSDVRPIFQDGTSTSRRNRDRSRQRSRR